MPSRASVVPMPVTMATTRRPSSVPSYAGEPPSSVLRSANRRTRGFTSIGIAQMKASASSPSFTRPVCRTAATPGQTTAPPSPSGAARACA